MTSNGPGPRDYSTGTVNALFALSGTSCYHPDCPVTVVKFLEDEAFTDVQIAHIYGANKGAARYDPAMTNDQRRAFSNLMLLCKPHHELVDKRHPERYPAETLLKWKTQREAAAGIDRKDLSGITEDDLLALIEQVVTAAGPRREAVVELGMGFAGSQLLILPPEKVKEFIDLDNYKDLGPKVLALSLRSSGSLPIYWASEAIRFEPCGAALLGRNDFPYLNPSMPRRIEAGDSAHWFYDLALVTTMVTVLRKQGYQVDALVAKVSLGSGEELESNPLPADYLPI
ncbi:hypothetical protein AB0280_17780 [Pseudarthrobacter sp902506025]|uniref:hypothetical protein n=1 Tax=Pseudarthrobacter sp. 902506025 TaxID=3155291 RepID=UPI00344F633C